MLTLVAFTGTFNPVFFGGMAFPVVFKFFFMVAPPDAHASSSASYTPNSRHQKGADFSYL
jgi:hypothetical protein